MAGLTKSLRNDSMNGEFKILRWNNIHAILFSFLFIQYTIFPVRYPLIVAGGFSFLFYWLINYNALKTFRPFAGYANRITLLRLILIIVSGIWYNELSDIIIFILGSGIFCLDGLDGFIARRLKQTSEFGAYFDMETDAFFVCIFSIILYEKGLAGYWIIIPGFMRYLYGLVILLTGKKSNEKIRSRYGPLIAGLFFCALLSPFLLSVKYYGPVLIIASGLLMLSFAYSFFQIQGIRPQ